MDEKFLFKISLLCSLLGIFIILLIVERLDVGEFSIDSVNLSLVDKEVKVKGYITSIKEKEKLALFGNLFLGWPFKRLSLIFKTNFLLFICPP